MLRVASVAGCCSNLNDFRLCSCHSTREVEALDIKADAVAWSYGMWLDHPAIVRSPIGHGMVGSIAAGAHCGYQKAMYRNFMTGVCSSLSSSEPSSSLIHVAGPGNPAVVRCSLFSAAQGIKSAAICSRQEPRSCVQATASSAWMCASSTWKPSPHGASRPGSCTSVCPGPSKPWRNGCRQVLTGHPLHAACCATLTPSRHSARLRDSDLMSTLACGCISPLR